MKEFIRFIKSSGIYFVGTVMTKLITFFLLPLYTAYISPADYGMYDLYNVYITFLTSVLFLDIWSGIMRFMFDYKNEEKKTPINSGFAIFCISCCLYAVILFFAAPILKLDYVFWLLLYGILMNTQTLMGYIARGYGKNVLYTSAGIVSSLVTILFNILLLVVFKMNYSALFIASVIGYVVNILIILIGIREFHVFSIRSFDKKVFKDILIFSLPLCLNSVAYWFLTSYNRVVVVERLGVEANGYYAIAARFGSMITLFTTCFQMAWQELAYSKSAKEDNLGEFYSTAINNYIKCMGAGLLLLIPVIFVIYPLLIHESYTAGMELVPYYLLGTILSTISSFLGNTFSAIKKNRLLFWTMICGSVCNVVVINLLIDQIGLQASNISLACGFFVLCLTRVLFLKHEIGLKVEIKSIVCMIIAFLGVSYIYLHGTVVMNIIAFVICIVLMLYLFKDIVKMIFNVIKDKLRSA